MAFKKRHVTKLSQRKPELLTKARTDALTEKTVDSFHDMLKKLIGNGKIVPESIYNLDETGLNTNPIGKVFVDPKSKDAYTMNSNCGKAIYSVLFCSSAVGRYLPPFVVYKGKYLYSTWTESAPAGCRFAVSPSGWMHDYVFENWFMEHFIPFVADNQKPVLVIYDGHGSHLTFKTVEAAMENDVVIVCLPPNCSHALQSLAMAVFKPLKAEWKKILKRFARESRLSNVDKSSFPGLLKQLCQKLNPVHAISGFRNAGIVPLDKQKMKRCVTSVSEVSGDNDIEDVPSTPQKWLPEDEEIMTPNTATREAVNSVIDPKPSKATIEILKNKKAHRKRVQSKVLTTEEVKKGLRPEEIERKVKKKVKTQRAKLINEDMEISTDDDSHQSMADLPDDVDSGTPSEETFSLVNLPKRFEDIQCYLNHIWKGLSPPVLEEDIMGSCYGAIFQNKRMNQLYIGKLARRFLSDENESVELEELRPKSGGGTDLEQPPIDSRSFGLYKLEDIIAGPLKLIPTKNGYQMQLYPTLLKLHTMLEKLDRHQFIEI